MQPTQSHQKNSKESAPSCLHLIKQKKIDYQIHLIELIISI